ncbi:MAG: hypothetical protein HZA66_09720 [Rhodopseudomonas palustris]|uniref:Uncharacterized protein n=1 Tax=Rhodopseudomonas palustris TaxID=1076 RepID=A0A933S095_RHOPL|nr:hypothetical protein [Rhodopseudomonas palustris]
MLSLPRAIAVLGLVLIGIVVLMTGELWAANGPYSVDAADISELGSCKLESWLSSATNTDFSAVANPSCVVGLGKPVELTLQANRGRSDGEWGTTLSPKAKTVIVPTAIGRFGVSIEGGGSFDALTGANTVVFAVVPATYRLSETMRVNINSGWFWDRVIDQHYFSYGVGFDWKFTDTLQLTLEAFGLSGASDTVGKVRPRAQAGLRYRPNEIFSVDLIVGHNITGENARWITLGTTVRFPEAFR